MAFFNRDDEPEEEYYEDDEEEYYEDDEDGYYDAYEGRSKTDSSPFNREGLRSGLSGGSSNLPGRSAFGTGRSPFAFGSSSGDEDETDDDEDESGASANAMRDRLRSRLNNPSGSSTTPRTTGASPFSPFSGSSDDSSASSGSTGSSWRDRLGGGGSSSGSSPSTSGTSGGGSWRDRISKPADESDNKKEESSSSSGGGSWRDRLGGGGSSSGSSPSPTSSSPSTSGTSGGGSWRDRISKPADEGDNKKEESSSSSGGGSWRDRLGGGGSSSGSSPSPTSSGSSTSGSSTSGTSGGGSWRDRISKPADEGDSKKEESSSSSGGGGSWRDRLGGGVSSSGSSPSPTSSSPTSSGTSGGGSWRDRISKPADADDSKDKKDDKATGQPASSGGSWRDRLGGGSSTKAKEDETSKAKEAQSSPSLPSGGMRNRPGMGGNKPDDKSDPKAKSSKSAKPTRADAQTAKDKKDDADDQSSSGGGIFGRFRRGKQDDADEQAKDAKAKDDKSGDKSKKDAGDGAGKVAAAAAAGVAGGFASRIGRGKSDVDTKADDKTTAQNAGKGGKAGKDATSKADDKKPTQSPLGRRGRTQDDDAKSGKDDKKVAAAATQDATASGGIGGFLTRMNPFSGGDDSEDEKATSKSSASSKSSRNKARASKVPQRKSDGLTLDNKLDLLGVALVFGSLVLFFSAISSEQAAISGIHNFLGQLLGWGALAVPLSSFGMGMWLIVRHFGDDAPTVDPLRIVGLVIGYISLLVVFQYMDTFNPRYADVRSLDDLQVKLQLSWYVFKAGGGQIGAELYYLLVTTVTEIGGAMLIGFSLLVSLMLMTRLSASEMALFFIGMWRNMRDGMHERATARRAERRLQAQRRAEEQAAQREIVIPRRDEQPATIPAVAQTATSAVGHDIVFNTGAPPGTNQLETAQGQYPQLQPPQQMPQMPQQPAAQQASGNGGDKNGKGLLGGMFRRGRKDDAPQQPPQQMPQMPQQPAAYNNGQYAQPGQYGQPQPAQPNGTAYPQQPAAQQPPYTPPPGFGDVQGQPVSQEPHTPSLGDLLQPRQPAAQANDGQQTNQTDAVAARSQRLDAIRSGQTTPQQPAARVEQQPEQQPAPGGFSAFGRPDDVPRHQTEQLPYDNAGYTPPSRLPSAQPTAKQEPVQQHLAIDPLGAGDDNRSQSQRAKQQPRSSEVTNQTRQRKQWRLPDARTLLSSGSEQEFDREHLLKQARIIEDTLNSFGAPGRVVEVNTGPVVTQFGVEPDYIASRGGKKQRVKVSAIAALDKDLQLALGARSIRVEAPVPGKGYVGVEVPNEEQATVSLRDVMEDEAFGKLKSNLAIALGQSVSGQPVAADLSSMPHLLIAGTTGSGKSVCVNAVITSILVRNTPEQVRFIMVDPKRVELTGYNGIPHLVAPVVVELERIVGVLKWVTREMDDRYKRFSEAGARNIEDFNKHREATVEPMPYIVVIIDELADLMMLAPEETERTVTRIAALARATGIHLVIATQRPSVDVVTGLIKANFPARIAFAVAGGVDSRVILDQPGAERLLGKGDMLYLSGNSPAPQRLQGVFVSDMEINNVVRFWKMQALDQPAPRPISLQAVETDSSFDAMPRNERVRQHSFWNPGQDDEDDDDYDYDDDDDRFTDTGLDENAITGDTDEEDELYEQAVELVRKLNKASISLLQRRLRIGYTRAARLIDVMEARGVVGPAKEGSSKPRDVLPVSGD